MSATNLTRSAIKVRKGRVFIHNDEVGSIRQEIRHETGVHIYRRSKLISCNGTQTYKVWVFEHDDGRPSAEGETVLEAVDNALSGNFSDAVA